MKKIYQLLMAAGFVGAICLSTGRALAQAAPGGQGFGGGNFDPAQIQKYIMDNFRKQMDVTDDGEWKLISERIQKVTEARTEVTAGAARSMGRMFRRPGADGGQDGGQTQRRIVGGFGGANVAPGPEEEALQKAIDSNASNAELKTALAKFTEARKQKQAKLEKAQADLREVLSVRQEAIAAIVGLL